MLFKALVFLIFAVFISKINPKQINDVCSHITGQIYLEHQESGILTAEYSRNIPEDLVKPARCKIEFVTCPTCIINFSFQFLNISRNCGKAPVFDGCGCDRVWIYEPGYELPSEEQFCGRYIKNNVSLEYKSQTRRAGIIFEHSGNYGHAFTLHYISEGNKKIFVGFPKLNYSQEISSPFFPRFYPGDLSKDYDIECETKNESCSIKLLFTDFLIGQSSVIEIFDWNKERISSITGNTFRPQVIVTSGPKLFIKFYANGASGFGFKAQYTFLLENVKNETEDTNCGGFVNNLGGGITMMNMVKEKSKSFDCVWLIKPPETYYHKTHLYVKLVTFSNFGDGSELKIHEGLTSRGPIVENVKILLKEHVIPISQGFYINLKGVFTPESKVVLVYAAFNYKGCSPASDFLCNNLRCISILLQCDGFDHCGDNSDEFSINCGKDRTDRRKWSQSPNFLFPQIVNHYDTSIVAFLLCSLGLIGFIFGVAILLYRINQKAQRQNQIQDHIETIHAILDEGAGVEEEKIIFIDDPPDYEAPPDYSEIAAEMKRCSRCNLIKAIPDSPPPAYVGTSGGNVKIIKPIFIFQNVLPKNKNALSKFPSDSELNYSRYSDEEIAGNLLNCFSVGRNFTTDNLNSFL